MFRDGFGPDGQYLFLDGLSNGGHKHYDGNSISRLTQNRRIWLADCDYIKSLPKFHNGVLVFRNGQSQEIPPFVELERHADMGSTAFTETTVRSYAGVDWHRNILWDRGRFFLVVDEMEALARDDYSFRSVWQTLGAVSLAVGGLTAEQDGERFAIVGLPGPRLRLEDDAETGKNWSVYRHAEPVVRVLEQIANVRLERGETYRYFNLLSSSPSARSGRLRLTRMTPGAVRIDGGEEPLFAGVGDGRAADSIPGGPEVTAAQFLASMSRISLVDGTRCAWGGLRFASDRPVSVEWNTARGEGVVRARTRSRLSFAVFAPCDVSVDGKRVEGARRSGTVSFTVARGTHRFSLVPRAVTALARPAAGASRPPVASPREHRPARRSVAPLSELWRCGDGGPSLSLACADLDGDGRSEVAAGTEAGTVHLLSGRDGRVVGRFAAGGPVLCLASADLDGDRRPEIVAAWEDGMLYALEP